MLNFTPEPHIPLPATFAGLLLEQNEELACTVHHAHRVRGRRGIPNWRDWCYVPVNVVIGLCQTTPDNGGEFSAFAADFACASAWWLGKGIYRLDAPYLLGLWNAPLGPSDPLPVAQMLALPDWCLYVDCAGQIQVGNLPMHGFFAFLDDRFLPNGKRLWPELHLTMLLDLKGEVISLDRHIPLLSGQTLAQSLTHLTEQANYNGARIEERDVDGIAEELLADEGSMLTILRFISGYSQDLKRHGVPDYPRRKKVRFDTHGAPDCAETCHLYEMGDPSTGPDHALQ